MFPRFLALLPDRTRHPRRFWSVLAALAVLLVGGSYGAVQLWAGSQLRAARQELDRYHLAAAREHLRLYLKVRPRDPQALLLAGRAARQAEDFAEAARYLAACDALGARSEPVRDALQLEHDLLRTQAGEVDNFAEYLRLCVEDNHPKSALILEALAQAYLRLYRMPDAMTVLHVWLTSEPDSVPALLLRGRAWDRLHKYDSAVADYTRVLELDAGQDEARLRLTNAYIELTRFAEALPHLEYLRQQQPRNPDVLVRLAFCLNNQGQTERAEAILDDLLKVSPDSAPALSARGQLALQAGQLEQAERFLRAAQAQTPFDRQTNYFLGQCFQQMGREEDAQRQKTRLEEIEARLRRLIEISNRDMGARPNDPDLHAELGGVMLGLGHDGPGLSWLDSALRLDPKNATAHHTLAEYYERKGDAQKAAEHRRLAQEAKPTKPAGP